MVALHASVRCTSMQPANEQTTSLYMGFYYMIMLGESEFHRRRTENMAENKKHMLVHYPLEHLFLYSVHSTSWKFMILLRAAAIKSSNKLIIITIIVEYCGSAGIHEFTEHHNL